MKGKTMAKERILIVEDEEILSFMIKQILTVLDYEVIGTAQSGDEAKAILNERSCDLALMDIKINGDMDGIQTAEWINQKYDVPIIYLTAYVDDEILERAKSTGPYAYLLKPFREKELEITIQMVLLKHQTQRMLKESEKKFSSIFNYSADLNFIYDQSGGIREVNQSVVDALGYSREELQAMTIMDLLYPDYAELENERIVSVFKHSPQLFESVLLARNGTALSVQMYYNRIELDNQPFILSVAREMVIQEEESEMVYHETEADLEKISSILKILTDRYQNHELVLDKHQYNAAALACSVAGQLGLSRLETDQIYLAALLANIGRLHFDPIDSVYFQPDQWLTTLDQLHPRLAAEILSPIPGLKPISQIILHHQERLDGSGFPDHLTGSDIPLASQIVGFSEMLLEYLATNQYPIGALPEFLRMIQYDAPAQWHQSIIQAAIVILEEQHFQFPHPEVC